MHYSFRLIFGLLVLSILAAGFGWMMLRASLPQLDGERGLTGLHASVKIERDALGVPTIHGRREDDVMRALGFLHGQERFFQMDLTRRKSAGELAELLGVQAIDADREARVHRFRSRAKAVLLTLPEKYRTLLAAYTAGVNAGVNALACKPWEYYLLRSDIRPWHEEDSLLVVYTMWLNLQDEGGQFEQTHWALRQAGGEMTYRALAPTGDSHDAPLDGSLPPATILPPGLARKGSHLFSGESTGTEPVLGSNAFAVAGRYTRTGAAMLASDMHLGLTVPNVWYRAVLQFPDSSSQPRRIVGVTMPGLPSVAAGSNGYVAWGFTNSYVDTVDVVPVEVEGGTGQRYRTPEGWSAFNEKRETILVKGHAPQPFTSRWTRWGPLLTEPRQGRTLAIRWNAHDESALNFGMLDMLRANSIEEAIVIGHHAGLANQNLLLADYSGRIAWTVAGRVPTRSPGFDGLSPGNWTSGASGWTGWLPASEVPTILDPAEGLLWSANNRHVGGDLLQRLGDNGYDHGYRAASIRDRLRALVARTAKIEAAELLSVQLDDSARHLFAWRELLVSTLQDATDPGLQEIRELAHAWSGRAEPSSAGYRLVREFRNNATARVLEPFFAEADRLYPRFKAGKLHTEDVVLQLLRERPLDRLDPKFGDWEALLSDSVQAVAAEIAKTGQRPGEFTWAEVNRLEMGHPLSGALPRFISRWIDMPSVPLPGDADLPRNQTPRHGQSERLVVLPGHEEQGIFQMPGGQSGHPLSTYYLAGHEAWVRGEASPLLPGPVQHTLKLTPGD